MSLKYCLLALATAALPMFGQTLGEITGQVSDSSGAAIAGAIVTAANVATNAVRAAVSSDAGVYAFPSLAPGVYSIKSREGGV
jgi:protocatechuate 3,4-dioxygenase beta subunit